MKPHMVYYRRFWYAEYRGFLHGGFKKVQQAYNGWVGYMAWINCELAA